MPGFSDRGDERELWVLLRPSFEVLQKRGGHRVTVGVEQVELVRESFLNGPLDDAAHRCDADAASEKHRRLRNVLVQRERAHRLADFHLRAEWKYPYALLERRRAHAGCHCDC